MKRQIFVALIFIFGCASNVQDNISKDQPIISPQGEPGMVLAAEPQLVQDLTPELVGTMPISRLIVAAGRAYYLAEGGRGYPCVLHELNEAGEDGIVWRSATTQACDVWWMEATPEGLFMFLADGSMLQVKAGVVLKRGKIALPSDVAAPSWYMSWGLVLETRDRCEESSCSQRGHGETDEVVQDATHLYWLIRDKQGGAGLWALPMASGEARRVGGDMQRAQLAQRELGPAMLWRCEQDGCVLSQINAEDDIKQVFRTKDNKSRLIYSYIDKKIKGHCVVFLSEDVYDVMNVSAHQIVCVKNGEAKVQPFDKNIYDIIFPMYAEVDHKMPDAPAGYGNFSSVALGGRVWAIMGPLTRTMLLDQTSAWRRQQTGEIGPRAEEPTVMVSERGGAWRAQGPALRSAHSGPIGLRALRDGRVLFWARDQVHGFGLRVLSQDGKRVELLHALGAGEEVRQVRALGALVCYILSSGKRLCTYGAKNTTYLLDSVATLPAVTGLLQLREQDDHWMLVNAAGEILIKHSIDPDLVIDLRPDIPMEEKFVCPEITFVGERIVVSKLINKDKNIYELVSTDGTVKGTEVLGECDNCQKLPAMVAKMFKLNNSSLEDFGGEADIAKWLDDRATGSLNGIIRYNTLGWCQFSDSGESTCWESDGTLKGTRIRAAETRAWTVGGWTLREEEGEGEEPGSYVSTLIASNAGGEVGRTRYTPRSKISGLGQRLVWLEPLEKDEEGERGKRLVGWTPGARAVSELARWEDVSDVVVLGAQDGLVWFVLTETIYYSPASLMARAQVRLGVTDGTAAGTRLLETQGLVPLEPRPVLTPAGLVFSMDHPKHGLELFVWPVEAR